MDYKQRVKLTTPNSYQPISPFYCIPILKKSLKKKLGLEFDISKIKVSFSSNIFLCLNNFRDF